MGPQGCRTFQQPTWLEDSVPTADHARAFAASHTHASVPDHNLVHGLAPGTGVAATDQNVGLDLAHAVAASGIAVAASDSDTVSIGTAVAAWRRPLVQQSASPTAASATHNAASLSLAADEPNTFASSPAFASWLTLGQPLSLLSLLL